jgi:hypothetical protein
MSSLYAAVERLAAALSHQPPSDAASLSHELAWMLIRSNDTLGEYSPLSRHLSDAYDYAFKYELNPTTERLGDIRNALRDATTVVHNLRSLTS